METEQPSSNQSPMETETQPQQLSSSNNKLFVIVAASVFLTAIVTGSAVYFWQKSANEKAISRLEQKISSLEEQVPTMEEVKIPTRPTPSPVLSPTPITDPAANWKTYKNEKYSYSIKYPPTAEVKISKGDDNVSIYLFGLSTADRNVQESISFDISVNENEELNITNLDDLVERRSQHVTFIKKEKLLLGNQPAIKYTLKEHYEGKDTPEVSRTVGLYLLRNDLLYNLVVNYSGINSFNHEEFVEKIFDQILSTFKFLN